MRVWWYFSSQFLKSVFSILFFVLGIYFLLTYIEDSQHYFDSYHPQGRFIFLYYFWQAPGIAVQFLPFTVLIAGIIVNWVFAKHGEIAALRAAGCSMIKIASPLLCVGLFFTVAQFALSELVVPYATKHFLKVQSINIEGKKFHSFFTESHWLKAKNTVLHFKKYDEEKRELFHVEYFKTGQKNEIVSLSRAGSAYFDEHTESWVLRSPTVTQFPLTEKADGNVVLTMSPPFLVTNVDFPPPRVLKRTSASNQLSYWQLRTLIDAARAAGTNVSDRMVDLFLKISLPFANVLFVLLSLPFALKKERKEDTYIGIVICLLAALLYWFGNQILRNFAAKGTLDPLFAAWFMNVIVFSLGCFFVRKLDKGQ